MKTAIKSAALGFVALVSVNLASATTDPYTNAADLKLIGRQNNQPLYQLNINNATIQEVIVVIRDTDGEILHEEVLKGVNLSRTFLLTVNAKEEANLRIEVINRNEKRKSVLEFAHSTSDLIKRSKS